MAGGQGTRLRPLTCNIPKPMIPILGKPTMEYTMELLKSYGIVDIGVTLQYLPDEIMRYFGDGKEFGVNLTYFIEDTPLGTAGSVKNAEDFLNDTFIVISGDALTDIDLSKAIDYHKEKEAIATIVLKEVSVPLEYGVVVTDKEGRITKFLEKPSWGEVFSDKINTGIYILEPEIFSFYNRNQKFDFSGDLFPILLNAKKNIYGCIAEGYWCDIGNIQQFMNSQFDILKGNVRLEINGEKLKDGIWIGENCEISPRAKITPPVYIGNNCRIYHGARIGPFSVIGKNNIISEGTSIMRSILFDNCYVGSNAEIKGAVLSRKVQLESRTLVLEEAAIGDDTLLGERVIVKPGVSIWPNKIVEASTIVKSNIIWGGKSSKSMFGKRGIVGEVNIDITPEYVSKLGSAYGALLKMGSKVAISCSDDGAAQMFKYSIATGLLSMGGEVYDLKRMAIPMVRQAVTFFGVNGGIHVAVDKEDTQRVNILFMDSDGLDINKNMERKIENSFLREDYRRVKTDSIKRIIHLSDTVEYYTRQLINRLEVSVIRNSKYKIVISTKNSIVLSVLQNVLTELKINVRIFNENKDLIGLSKDVLQSGADLGISIDDEAERAILIDEKGNIIREDMNEALKALILLKSTKFNALVVPVTASSSIEQIAEICGANFVRTKTSHRNILEGYYKNIKTLSRREILSEYLNSLDALSNIMLTINFMALSDSSLSGILSKIPKYYVKTKEVICPWNMKGKVMRNLIEESSSKSVDLIEGVKLNYEDAWALILPDSEEPVCRVYTESPNSLKAENLNKELTDRIESIIGIDKDDIRI